MGRYTGPACKQCRREGMKLYLKGERCYMAKCPVQTGRGAPGQHGSRRRKLSDYGVQLREKQRLRRMYGMQEGQFRTFFARASRKTGLTGETLLQLLELRLDSVVQRLGFAPSIRAARQFIRHGHILLNGVKTNIPSASVSPGDIIAVAGKDKSQNYTQAFIDFAENKGIVPWLKLDRENLKGELLHVPTRDEMAPAVNEQLIVELYSK